MSATPPHTDVDTKASAAPDTVSRRALYVPLGFIILSLIALVLLPAPVQRRAILVQEELTQVIVPASLWVDEIELSIARQAAASRALAATGDPRFAAALEEARATQAEAERRLAQLAPHIGPNLPVLLGELQTRVNDWRRLQDALLQGTISPDAYLAQLPAQDSLHRAALAVVVQAEETIARERAELEGQVASARTIQFVLTLLLGALALGASVVVLWLGRRMRQVAETSERRRQEAVLAGRETGRVGRQLRALLESTGEGIYGLDTEGHVTFINRAGARILGYEPDELLGERIHDLIHHRRADGSPYPWSECPIQQTLREGITLYADAEQHWRKDGSTFIADVSAAPIYEDDEIRGAVVTFNDVTERRRAERAQEFLADASRLLSDSIELEPTLDRITHLAVPNLADYCTVHVLEGDDRVRRVAQAHRDPVREEMLNRAPAQARLDLDDERSILARVVRTGRSVLIVDAAGTSARDAFPEAGEDTRGVLDALDPRSILAVPLVTRGRIRGVMSLVIDESRRHYSPDDIDLFEELGRRAATAIDNASLFEETRRALHVRERVLSIVSHDLRNPLNTILLSAGLLKEMLPEEKLTDEEGRQLETIRRAVDRANRLIRDLLDVARLEAEPLPIERAPAAPAEIAEEAVELHRPLAEARNQTLELHAEKGLPNAMVDRDRIVQALSNLIGNAIDYTDEGGRIDVRVSRAGDGVRYLVKDTGRGIPEDEIEYIFDPFWQAARRGEEGAGLGLSIVKGIVDAHEGRISVESEPGKGSTFSFTVPTAGSRESRLAQAAD